MSLLTGPLQLNLYQPKPLASGAVGVGQATAALAVTRRLAGGATGIGTVSAPWGTFIWGIDGWGVVRLSVQHNLATVARGVGKGVGGLNLRHALATTAMGVGRLTGQPLMPTTLRVRLLTREGVFVWPEDSFGAARRDELPTHIEGELV